MENSGWSRSAVVAAFGAGAVAAAALLYVFKDGATTLGDEPPIRVKNGSMHFDLDAGEWHPDTRCTDGDGKPCWAPDSGESAGVFSVVVDPAQAVCTPPANATVDKVTITYSDGQKVMLKPGAKKANNTKRLSTKVRPHGVLSRDASNRARLSYGTPGDGGAIVSLELDGDDAQGNPKKWTCEFTDAKPLKEACIVASVSAAKCGP